MARPRSSLEWTLPLAICSALLVALGAFMALAYFDIRRSAIAASDERLRSLTGQLAGLLGAEAPGAIQSLRSVADQPQVRDYLVAPDSQRRRLAIEALEAGTPSERRAAVELWDIGGSRVLAIGDTTDLPGEGLLASMAGRDSGAVGPLMSARGGVVLPTIVPVLAGSTRLGYLVEWRKVEASQREREGMLQLIGSDAELLLGSPSTGIWTDRMTIVPPPPVSLDSLREVTSYTRGGRERRAMAAAVTGTPWVVLLEFSEQQSLAPARRFLRQTGVIAFGIFLVCLLLIWLIVRGITRPLKLLTMASESVSRGDYTLRVNLHRNDELGRLAAVFNEMAERVEHTHRNLQDTIHELRSTREQFAHAQRMEAVGRLAGGIAHDFNNLLTVILGETELALKLPDADATTALREIQRAGDRAAVLTRQLLAFSRRQLVEPVVFSMHDLAHDMEKMLARLIGEDIQLVTRLTAASPNVRADRGQIEQVLVNLVVNARDAMPGGGRLTVDVSNIVLDQDYVTTRPDVAPGEYVMLAVSDTGQGMSAEVRAHLFEPFFTTKDRSKGTGLGLATSYGIVKQSGGHIAAYSEPGVGTTMRVYLPAVPDALEVPVERVDLLPSGTERILLVEDDAAVRATASRILTKQGYRILEAGTGAEALELLAQAGERVDLMITDVVLPGMGGRELAERVSAERPEIRVLYVSGYTDDVILQHKLVERDVDLLQKPFTVSALATKVRAVLDRP